MSFLKNIWRTSSKHKKLSEEWALAKNNKEIDIELSEPSEEINTENEDSIFKLKYIGSTLVDRAANESTTADAIKSILRVAKAGGKKLPRVTVEISLKGIKISEDQSGKDNEISIYKNFTLLPMPSDDSATNDNFRISYCSADATNSRVFAFIAANSNETMECHAFLCRKRKHAQSVTLAVARAFSMAYEAWRVLPSSASKEKQLSAEPEDEPLNQLIDLDDFDEKQPPVNMNITVSRPHGFTKNEWVSFDDDNESQRWTNNQHQQIDLICS